MKKPAKIATTELVAISSLKPHPRNYRKHGADQIAHIQASIKANGFYRNVVVAVDGTILAGHGAVESAKALGIVKIPVVRLNLKPTDKRALRVLTGDNEAQRLGEVDDRALSEILKDLAVDTDGLLGTGFDEKQLANLVFVTRHSEEIKDFNAANEWLGLPAYDAKDDSLNGEPVIVISFKTEKDRERFVSETKLRIKDKRGNRRWSTVWPFEERKDFKAVRFEEART